MESVIIPCPRCGTKNRIPRNRLGDRPLCGKCGTPFPARGITGSPVMVSDDTFAAEVLSEPGLVLVDFWAPWCGPCRMIAPILEELAREYAGRLKVGKLNVDENPLSASRYETRSIPTMLLFRDGQVVDRLVGAMPRAEIEKRVLSHV